MSKILIILNIEQQLYYQVYKDGKPIGGLLLKKNVRTLENTVQEILNDRELKNSSQIGTIVIDENDDIQRIIKSFPNIELLEKYDSYINVLKGNSSDNYKSWCIIDGLFENVTVYDLKDNQRIISLNKQEAKDNLYNGVIDKTFPSEKPIINEGEKSQLVDEWIQTLKVQKELRGSKRIGNKTESLNVDYKQAAIWLFGNFINDTFNNFPDKTFFYFLGEFVNHTILFEQIETKGYQKEFKSKSESYEFIINGAYGLCQKNIADNFNDINKSGAYTENELKERYNKKSIRFFMSFDDYKIRFTSTREVEVQKAETIRALTKEISDDLFISEDRKKDLLKRHVKPYISSEWISEQIDKLIEGNIQEHEKEKLKIRGEIIAVINKNRRDKGRFTSLKSAKKNASNELNSVNTEGFDLDKNKTLEEQWRSLEIFYSDYKENPNGISTAKLPEGIDSVEESQRFIHTISRTEIQRKYIIVGSILSTVLLIVVLIGANMDFGDTDGGDDTGGDGGIIVNGGNGGTNGGTDDDIDVLIIMDYSKNPAMLEDAFDEIQNRENDSLYAKEIAEKITSDLKNWRIKSNSMLDGIELQEEYTFKEFTNLLRGDRIGDKTIKVLEINEISKSNKNIRITLKMNVL
jgi:hypothetical protein